MHCGKIKLVFYFFYLFSFFSGRSQVRQNSNLPFSSTFPDFNEFSPDFPFNPVFDSNKVSPDPFYQPDPYPSEPHHSDRYTPGSSPVIKLRPEYQPEPAAYQVHLQLNSNMYPVLSTIFCPNSHLHPRPLRMLLQCPPRLMERPPMQLPHPPTINQHPNQPTTSQHPRPTTFLLDLSSLTSDPMR